VPTGIHSGADRWCSVVAIAVVLAAFGWPVTAHGTPEPISNLEGRELAERLLLQQAAAVARERKIASANEETLFKKLTDKDRALQLALDKARTNAGKLQKVSHDLDQLAKERTELLSRIEQRDRQFAAEVAAYRETVTKLANDPSPERRAALKRYADGDRVGGFAVLDDLAQAEMRGRDAAAKLADAATMRSLTPFALEMHGYGEMKGATLRRRFEQLVALDPGVSQDWLHLSSLYAEAGLRKEAEHAAGQARGAAEEASKLTPNSADAQLDLLVTHLLIGQLAVERLDADAAWTEYGKAQETLLALQTIEPDSERTLRLQMMTRRVSGSLAVSLNRLEIAGNMYSGALDAFQALAERQVRDGALQREAALLHGGAAELAQRQGHLPEAVTLYQQALAILRSLATANPRSLLVKRDLWRGTMELGDAALAAGNEKQALAAYRNGTVIADDIAKADAGSSQAARDAVLSLVKSALVDRSAASRKKAMARLDDLRQSKRLNEKDELVFSELTKPWTTQK
jgi:tetratricopeptide (TPR) repeat protein